MREEIFVGIAARNIRGLRDIKLLRRKLQTEVELITIMSFASLAAVREPAGKDYDLAVVPPMARQLHARFDQRSQQYELGVGNSQSATDRWRMPPAEPSRPSILAAQELA